MNNIYVDELPEDCLCCPCESEYFCNLLKTDIGFLKWGETHKECPLKLITDRLAEERKKVVQEIKERLIKYTGFDEEYLKENIYDADMGCVLKQIDKFERGE
jgi:hypothetical protein